MNLSLIQKVPLFAGLPADEIQRLAESLRSQEYPADQIIFLEGDPSDHFYILLEGDLEVVKALGSPEERVLSTLSSGDFLGEMGLLYPDRRRSASVRTRTTTQLLEMRLGEFEDLLQRQPALSLQLLREMGKRLRNSENATIRDLQEKNRQLARAYQDLQAAQAQVVEKEKLEHELAIARKIQESTLPKEIPALDGWQLAAYWQPARAVSGDFYDFIQFPNGHLGLVVGDVSGKGVPAALIMATTLSVFRAAAEQFISPGQALKRVNDILVADMPANMFVTCLYALLDTASGHLVFANAGHNLPYQWTAQGVLEPVARGMPLGLMPEMKYEENEVHVAPGEHLLMYSDGLVEARNAAGVMFGFPRLKALIAGRSEGAGLIEYLLGQLANFTGPGWEQDDDVTCVMIQRTR